MRGREQEWLVMSGLLEQVSRGGSGTILIEGEPGIGKSRMLAEAAKAAAGQGFIIAAAAADELSQRMPAGPLLLALGEPLSASVLGARQADPAGQPMWLMAAVRERIERRARAGPLLICLDDLQWADPVTLVSLRLLPLQLAACPVAWVLSRSDLTCGDDASMLFELLASEGASRLVLPPLADGAVAALVADAVGAPPGPELRALAATADGNPGLLGDLLARLQAADSVTIEGGQAVLAGPETLECGLSGASGRLARLSSRARQLVHTAAVLGQSFRLEDAAAMLGTSAADLLPAVDEAAGAGLLVATADALRFRHQLIWQAIADDLAPPVRQALHRQFGEILLARDAPVQAAEHLMASARVADPPGLARLDEALPGVLLVSPRAAADLAAYALSLTGPGDPARLARTVTAAVMLVAASRLDEADRVIHRALIEPMPGYLEARLHGALARVLHLRGRDSPAIVEAEQALAEPGLPSQVRDYALIALLQALAGRPDNRRGADIASAIRRQSAGYTREVQVAALIVLSLIRWDEGRMAEALQLCHESVLLAGGNPPDVRLAQARLTLAARLIDLRRFGEAGRLIELARQQGDTLTDLEPAADPALLRARIELAEGRLDDAVAQADSARQIAAALGAHARLEHALAILAHIAMRRGDLGAARKLQPDPGQAAQAGTAGPEWRVNLVAAKITEASSGPMAAMTGLAPFYRALADHRWMLIAEPGTAPWLVRVALAAGDRGSAEQAAAAAAGLAAANPGFPTVLASAAHAGGLLAAEPGRISEAVHQHTDLWARASAAEDLGVLQLRDGSTPVAGAVASLDDALDGYQRGGAVRDAARVRRRLRQAGVRRRHWTTNRGPEIGWDSLTDTERSISDLVSQGLSNQEVALRKYVSVHTVAFHLRQVFRKLSITSRVELARIVIEQAGSSLDGLAGGPAARRGLPSRAAAGRPAAARRSRPWLGSGLPLRRLWRLVGHGELTVSGVDPDHRPAGRVAAEQCPADPGFHLMGDEAAQRAGPVHRVESPAGDEPAGLLGQLKAQRLAGQPLPQIGEHQVHDPLDFRLG